MYTIYGRPNCIFCEASKTLLDNINRTYNYIDITNYSSNEKEELKNTFNMKTIPIILNYHGKLLGGYNELQREVEETSGGYGDG